MSEFMRFNGELMHPFPSLDLMESFSHAPTSWEDLPGTNPTFKSSAFIGRFQGFHTGHLWAIYNALAISKSVVIGIGSSNVINFENPFPAEYRHQLIDRILRREGIRDRVSKIVHIPDHDDDGMWLKKTIEKTGEVQAVVGNNGWVNGIFANSGYAAVEIPMYERNKYKGKNVRGYLRSKGFLSHLPSADDDIVNLSRSTM